MLRNAALNIYCLVRRLYKENAKKYKKGRREEADDCCISKVDLQELREGPANILRVYDVGRGFHETTDS